MNIEDKIKKLPAWAREHIKIVEREREAAVALLKRFQDEQTPSSVSYRAFECLGANPRTGEKKSGPSEVVRYIQTDRVTFSLPRADMELQVHLDAAGQRVYISTPRGYPYIEPINGNYFAICPKEGSYLNPDAVTLCRAAVEASKLGNAEFVRKFGFSHYDLEAKMRQVVPVGDWNRTVGG